MSWRRGLLVRAMPWRWGLSLSHGSCHHDNVYPSPSQYFFRTFSSLYIGELLAPYHFINSLYMHIVYTYHLSTCHGMPWHKLYMSWPRFSFSVFLSHLGQSERRVLKKIRRDLGNSRILEMLIHNNLINNVQQLSFSLR